MGIDYRSLGLRVGLEVHRQLSTKSKLFCECPVEPSGSGREVTFVRELRPAQSELGEIDPATLFESQRARKFVYKGNTSDICLVEMDEEPPHPINEEAVEVALTVALLLNSEPVDELHVMRKVVIDGSNTSGFQRTCIVATGGSIRVGDRDIPIQAISLEEDSARIVETRAGEVVYDLQRLGIPLIEVSTAPEISTPEEAMKVAKSIGDLMRATGKVRRGIGSVRQDLNISIVGNCLVEVKGVQELELMPSIIDYEVRRMSMMRELSSLLRERGVTKDAIIMNDPVDLTDAFSNTGSRLVKTRLLSGDRVVGLRLPHLAGLLKSPDGGPIRLGREVAEYVRAWTGVEGVIHSDEVPGYGISQREVEEVRGLLNSSKDDAFVLVMGDAERARAALQRVRERLIGVIQGVIDETRAPLQDGTTQYARPRPSAARLYPETDIPPLVISREYLMGVRARLPRRFEEVIEELRSRYNLSGQLVAQLIDEDRVNEFEELVKLGIAPSFAASFLTEVLKELKRDGLDVDSVPFDEFLDFFRMVVNGETAKEAARDVVAYLARNRGSSAREAVVKLGYRAPRIEEVIAVIDALIDEYSRSGHRDVTGPVMGELMKRYRGKVDGAVLSRLVRERTK
ncbi:MAG: Glu-tRNA(Gln) amidotransferase subunit GatE [Aigarchaeota archaeon]|nr:Glu-tRNA(Gln) amidotransferase subunit GatE [Aigarchaeota archaeon]MDW8092349.1 Glu-tRNA(Gln) amidotransferase subunit GatE [Nitrososphaerota archaeon]